MNKRILTLIVFVNILIVSLACAIGAIPASEPEAGSAAPPSASLLPTEGTPFEHPEPPSEAVQLCAVVTADEALHLRIEPNEHARHIQYLAAGQVLTVLDPDGDLLSKSWWRVKTQAGAAGYANARYLQETKCQ